MKKLPYDVAAQVAFRTGTGNDKTRGSGNKERRNLADKAFTYRQQSICLQGLNGLQIALHHTDDKTASDIDKHDDDRGNGITFNKL